MDAFHVIVDLELADRIRQSQEARAALQRARGTVEVLPQEVAALESHGRAVLGV